MRMSELEQLTAVWRARALGRKPSCAACGDSRVALQVSGVSYRWRCVPCGHQSAWFFVGVGGIRVEGRWLPEENAV
jgi:hypothetical protein